MKSHLTRGAWIEMEHSTAHVHGVASHLTRGAWIEIRPPLMLIMELPVSHLTRGAWIEISYQTTPTYPNGSVAPHTRCVD